MSYKHFRVGDTNSSPAQFVLGIMFVQDRHSSWETKVTQFRPASAWDYCSGTWVQQCKYEKLFDGYQMKSG